jgi:hypothetical protein
LAYLSQAELRFREELRVPGLKRFQASIYRRIGILVVVFGLFTPLAAHAQGRDVVQFASDIVVHENEEVHDVVCFLCSIEIDGNAQGDLVAFAGNIRVKGQAGHDAVAFLGDISLGENASIGNDAVVIAGSLRTAPGSTIGRDRVAFPFILFLMPFLVLAGIVALIIWAIRSLMYRPRPVYPMPPPRM